MHSSRVFVVPACHFIDSKTLCDTTIKRLRVAILAADPDIGDAIVVTGDVPYELGSPTLGELMNSWLIKQDFPAENIIILREGVGTFSEARIMMDILHNHYRCYDHVTLVSSKWYLFQAKQIWRRRAKEKNIDISYISIIHTGGWRTVLTYTILGIIVRSAIMLGLESFLERRLTAQQQSRRNGFKFNGCA